MIEIRGIDVCALANKQSDSKNLVRALREKSLIRDAVRWSIPEQEVDNVGFNALAEVLKDAWTKYLSVVVLCWLLLSKE